MEHTIVQGDKDIKKYLRELADNEKDKLKILSNRESAAHQRRTQIEYMAKPNLYLNGFMYALKLAYGLKTAKYYEDYYYQALSDKGVDS